MVQLLFFWRENLVRNVKQLDWIHVMVLLSHLAWIATKPLVTKRCVTLLVDMRQILGTRRQFQMTLATSERDMICERGTRTWQSMEICSLWYQDIIAAKHQLKSKLRYQWRCELTPFSQGAHLNISPWGITVGSQFAHTVRSQETNSQWAHCYHCMVSSVGWSHE